MELKKEQSSVPSVHYPVLFINISVEIDNNFQK